MQVDPVPGSRVALGRSLNCRDVGGRPTARGAVRRGLLFRSDLPLVDEGSAHHLESLRLRTVVDLREPDERVAEPAGLGRTPPRVLAMPSGLGPIVAADPSKAGSVTALYRAAVLETGPLIAAVVTELARPGALPALVHCAAGKDRTGVVVAVLLSALGVDDEEIALDYTQSAVNLDDAFFEDLENRVSPEVAVDLTALRSADADDVLHMLALVRKVAGSARDYLRHHGVSEAALVALERALVDGGEGAGGPGGHGGDPA